METTEILLDEVLGLLEGETERIALGRRRQAAVWRGGEPDYLPLLFSGPAPPERAEAPRFDLRQCYFDPDKMLVEQAWAMAAVAGRLAGWGAVSQLSSLLKALHAYPVLPPYL